jgi:ElaB/YqjD/DUF883 family membrane-anchored ribosome-binding protein
MKQDLKSPEHIYTSVSNEVNNILKNLEPRSKDEKLSEAKRNAIKILKQFQAKIETGINSLDKNSRPLELF